MFADGTKLYTVLQDDSAFSADFQLCLDSILDWSAVRQLKSLLQHSVLYCALNPERVILFTCAPCHQIGSVQLPVIENCTDLGVSYDANLSFSPHVNKIVAEASC
jgi:hypothetical protein